MFKALLYLWDIGPLTCPNLFSNVLLQKLNAEFPWIASIHPYTQSNPAKSSNANLHAGSAMQPCLWPKQNRNNLREISQNLSIGTI